jgi:APA family basic amino acid/polyamine antiporter
MLLYVLLNFVYMHVLPLEKLAAIDENSIAAAVVANALLGKAGTIMIAILIATSTFGALNACILVYPRAYYRMAQEGFFFRGFSNVHPVFRTPYISLLWSMIWAIVLVVTGTFDLLTNLIIFAGFFFYVLLAIGLVILKRKGVITAKVIGYPLTPVIIILFALALIINTLVVQTKQSIIGLFLVLSGVPVYYYFKRKGSRRME